jgi:hypothetical protein
VLGSATTVKITAREKKGTIALLLCQIVVLLQVASQFGSVMPLRLHSFVKGCLAFPALSLALDGCDRPSVEPRLKKGTYKDKSRPARDFSKGSSNFAPAVGTGSDAHHIVDLLRHRIGQPQSPKRFEYGGILFVRDDWERVD